VLALAGGLSVAFGCKTRWGALLLLGFLVPVTPLMHNFWTVADPAQHQMQAGFFLRNVAFVGSALIIAYFGAGPVSMDRLLATRHKRE
jgi:putative oxidoreductase